MKKSIFFFLVLQIHIYGMENEIPQEIWNIKKTIQHNLYIKSTTYNSINNQLLILDEKNATLVNIDNEKQTILPHCSSLWKPTFDKLGRYILTRPNSQKTITLSNTDGKEIAHITLENYSEIVKFDHQGNQILIAGENTIQLRNLDCTLITDCNLESKYSIKIAKFFPNNNNLIFIAPFERRDVTSKAKVWDIRNKNVINYDYIDPLTQASIHPEGTYLACIRQEMGSVAYVYDLRKKGHIHLSNFNKPKSAKFNSSGTHILTQYYQKLALLWKIKNTIECITTQEHPNFSREFNPKNLSRATFHPYGNQILTTQSKTTFNSENNFSIWDFDGNQLSKIPHKKTIYSAKYDSTGNYIISRHENIITLWKKENS